MGRVASWPCDALSVSASTAAPSCGLAHVGRGHGLPAATIVPLLMSSPLPYVNFTMDTKGVRCWCWTLAIVLGPWSNRDAMTNAAILDLQLTFFWRHLCGDAFRRQLTSPSDRQRARIRYGVFRGRQSPLTQLSHLLPLELRTILLF